LSDRLAERFFKLLDPAPFLGSVRLVVVVAIAEEHLLGCHGESLPVTAVSVNVRFIGVRFIDSDIRDSDADRFV